MVKNVSAYEAFVVLRNFFAFGFAIYLGFSFGRFVFRNLLLLSRWLFTRNKKDR